MPRLPRVTAKQIITVIEQRGFVLARSSGSHMIFIKNEKRVTVPFHGAVILHPKVLKSILQDASVSVDDFVTEL